MRKHKLVSILALALFAATPQGAAEAEPARLNPDGSLDLAGHRLQCNSVRTRLDRRLANLGAASPFERLLLINPVLLAQERPTVQLFVFHHECGHHRVGASELEADCWAVGRGVEGGWLDRKGLAEVCKSFGGGPASRTHPAARDRCANLDRCFADANARAREVATKLAPASPAKTSSAPAVQAQPKQQPQPQLVVEPQLVRTGNSQ